MFHHGSPKQTAAVIPVARLPGALSLWRRSWARADFSFPGFVCKPSFGAPHGSVASTLARGSQPEVSKFTLHLPKLQLYRHFYKEPLAQSCFLCRAPQSLVLSYSQDSSCLLRRSSFIAAISSCLTQVCKSASCPFLKWCLHGPRLQLHALLSLRLLIYCLSHSLLQSSPVRQVPHPRHLSSRKEIRWFPPDPIQTALLVFKTPCALEPQMI